MAAPSSSKAILANEARDFKDAKISLIKYANLGDGVVAVHYSVDRDMSDLPGMPTGRRLREKRVAVYMGAERQTSLRTDSQWYTTKRKR